MKKHWMVSVIDASKQDIPALPFQRGQRRVRGMRDKTAGPVLRKTA